MGFSIMLGNRGITLPSKHPNSALYTSAGPSTIFAVMWRKVFSIPEDGSSRKELCQGESFISLRIRSTGSVVKEYTARLKNY
jgi:hypothetical protein